MPSVQFSDLNLLPSLQQTLNKIGYDTPTPIQAQTIPLVLAGDDVLGIAQTGTGKTAAFCLPMIHTLAEKRNRPEPKFTRALILTPTRELAIQIHQNLEIYGEGMGQRYAVIFGGVSQGKQVAQLKKGVDVLVATPGRLLDLIDQGYAKLNRVEVFVLDEADRMVDMGFLPDVERIIGHCPSKRQTMLFSATISQDVKYISKKYMKEPKQIIVETYVDASKLKQVYYDTPNSSKFSLLVHLMKKEKSGIVMVFCNTRRNVDMVSDNLKRYKIHAHAIHGGLEQKKRSRVIEKFHTKEAEILVCTDVAARGLDIRGVTHVYNYDIPRTSDEYIHRIGRTARAGEEGLAISIVSNRDYDNFRKVLEDDSLKIKLRELPQMEKLSPRFDSGRSSSFGGRPSSGGFGGRSGGRDSGRSGGRKPTRR